ncbi:MAG: rRNA maturation RNase YbeY [Lentisphaeria bacterium]|nr:rRNA maturation RNase YbeY [Lentisphaeria bacterium]
MKVIYSWKVNSCQVQSSTVKAAPLLKKFAARAAELAHLPEGDWVFSINFLDDRKMEKANMEYLGHEGTTDVITFSYLDDMECVFPGDIGLELLICSDFAEREGDRRKKSFFKRELALYIVHGVLHAAGYDDLSPAPRKLMRSAEFRLMKKLAAEFNFNDLFIAKN